MKISNLLFKPVKTAPANADTLNHKLLVQGGFVRQTMAGVYTYTPLGLRVLKKIEDIIREEMNALGSQEIHMPALHPKQNWVQSGGWDSIDVLFKIKSRTDREYALGQSHEEIVTPLVKELINSAKDLPISLYQIQWKFRDELRAKSGIMRGREFLMKDMYSFHASSEDFLRYYETVKTAYLKVFDRLGLEAKVTQASGGNFTDKISYEYMVLTDAGEDDILYCPICDFAINTEISKELQVGQVCPACQGHVVMAARASEAGNIFDLGDKFTRSFDISFKNSAGNTAYPVMGCYGIGVTRNMGIIVEKHADERGIVWPKNIAPFQVHLVPLFGEEKAGHDLYHALQKQGVEVIIDDRADISPGAKFACADLIGCPTRVVLSEKNKGQLEIKQRDGNEIVLMPMADFLKTLG
jgi:prolyl-tRNA synthetase